MQYTRKCYVQPKTGERARIREREMEWKEKIKKEKNQRLNEK